MESMNLIFGHLQDGKSRPQASKLAGQAIKANTQPPQWVVLQSEGTVKPELLPQPFILFNR
jgi:hypothetical protein